MGYLSIIYDGQSLNTFSWLYAFKCPSTSGGFVNKNGAIQKIYVLLNKKNTDQLHFSYTFHLFANAEHNV